MVIDPRHLAKLIDTLPAFPESVSKILQLTANEDLNSTELVEVVERDMVMTVRVLKLVNSAMYGLVGEVTSVKHAVVYVGSDTVKNLAISIATAGSLPKTNNAGLDMDTFWLQSLSVGVIAKLLAEREEKLTVFESADYFVAGLLHNIGKIVLAYFYPQEYSQVLKIAEQKNKADHLVERELFGLDHSELGAMLAEEWQLPIGLVHAIKNHHALANKSIDIPPTSGLTKTIFCASQIFHRLNANKREQDIIPQFIESWLGNTIEETIDSLTNIEEEIDKAMIFISD